MLPSFMQKLSVVIASVLLLTACSPSGGTGSTGKAQDERVSNAATIYGLNLSVPGGKFTPSIAFRSPTPAMQMASGAYLDGEGAVWAYPPTAEADAATKLEGLPPFTMIDGDGVSLFGVTESGTVMQIKGNRTSSMDGHPDPPNSFGELKLTEPTTIPNLSNIRTVQQGARQVLAIDTDGGVWGWGLNVEGVLGPENIGEVVVTPRQLEGLPPAQSVAFGARPMILADDGSVWEWGRKILQPRRIETLPHTFAISSTLAQGNSYALSSDGVLYGWQLKDTDLPPTPIADLPAKPKSLSRADAGIYVVDEGGSVWAYGDINRLLKSEGSFVQLEGINHVMEAWPSGAGLLVIATKPPEISD